MDNFFSTKKAVKSFWVHTCCQLFVTDKGFLYAVTMCNKYDVFQATKQFAKEMGDPEDIISDTDKE